MQVDLSIKLGLLLSVPYRLTYSEFCQSCTLTSISVTEQQVRSSRPTMLSIIPVAHRLKLPSVVLQLQIPLLLRNDQWMTHRLLTMNERIIEDEKGEGLQCGKIRNQRIHQWQRIRSEIGLGDKQTGPYKKLYREKHRRNKFNKKFI